MAMTENNSVLRRKLGGSPAEEPAEDRSSIRALRLATARVSRDMLDLRLDVIGGAQGTNQAADLPGLFANDHLLMVFEGEAGVSAAVALGPELVGALIQQQTFGTLVSLDGQARAFTDTDAALCAPFAEAVLARASELAESAEDRACLQGHRFSTRGQDPASVVISLEGDRFRVFDLTLDIAVGTGQSRLIAVLPEGAPRAREPAQGMVSDGTGETLGHVASNASVRLNAVMCRVPLPLSELSALNPGDLLPLPAYRLDRTELLTMSGQSVGTGRLGRVEGLRAVRVNETTAPETDFTGPSAPRSAPPAALALSEQPGTAQPPEEEDFALDQLDQDEAIKRISELAGLEQEAGQEVTHTLP